MSVCQYTCVHIYFYYYYYYNFWYAYISAAASLLLLLFIYELFFNLRHRTPANCRPTCQYMCTSSSRYPSSFYAVLNERIVVYIIIIIFIFFISIFYIFHFIFALIIQYLYFTFIANSCGCM